jgi:ABC-type transport system substrate-binding protein
MFRNEPGTYSLLDWDVYFPRHLLEDLDPAEFFLWEFWTQPVGNGPYRYVNHDPETHIEFEANPDYYEGEPTIKRLIITLVRPIRSMPLLLPRTKTSTSITEEGWLRSASCGT